MDNVSSYYTCANEFIFFPSAGGTGQLWIWIPNTLLETRISTRQEASKCLNTSGAIEQLNPQHMLECLHFFPFKKGGYSLQ